MKREKKKSEEKEQEEKKETPQELEKRMTLYAYVILGIIALMLVLLTIFLISNYFGKHFTYEGLEFNKITEDNRITYTTNLVIKNFFNGTLFIDNKSFYFRNDPRTLKLKEEPEKISVITRNLVYVSLDEPLPRCQENILAASQLGTSLTVLGLKVKGAIINSTKAQMDYPEITCANSTKNTVILISQGNSTAISQIQDNCYSITYKDCEILKAAERFTLKLLEQAAAAQNKINN